jgi:Ca2+-binding RTX toxin-like protein
MSGSSSSARPAPRRRTIAAVSAIVLLGGGWAAPASAKPKLKAANGSACTVVGTNGNDRLQGTARDDVLCGLGGNDTLTGNGGNDVLDGGAGDDSLLGGAGADTHLGGPGADTASYAGHTAPVTADLDGVADDGGKGERDRIMTDVENITGGAGADRLTGNNGRNELRGGAGGDVLDGGPGNDSLDGSAGKDRLGGGDGDDAMDGGDDTDDLDGSKGNDKLNGGRGDDDLDGSVGNDKLNGGEGDDTMTGGPGADDLDGGTGENTCSRDNDDISPENACSDTEAPVVDAASVELVGATTLTNAQDNVVTLRARATDTRSGVASVSMQLQNPSGGNGGNDMASKLVSGTRYDGVWEAKVTIPRYAVAGDWRVFVVHASDKVGHHVNIIRGSDGAFTSYPAQVPVPIELPPITITGDADTDAPVIDTANLEWLGETELDNAVYNPIALRVPVTDAQSGVAGVYGWFGTDTTNDRVGPSSHRNAPVSGTLQDGVWVLSGVIPKYARTGAWRLRQLCAYDDLMNHTCYWIDPDGTYRTFAGDTVTLALPPLTLGGEQSDTSLPVVDLKSFKWHGDHQFSNNVDNVVKLRADFSDDLSGLSEVSCVLGRVGGGPGGSGSGQVVHGTERDGTWEFAITLPKFAPAGQYRITDCLFIDRVGNRDGLHLQADGSYTTLDQQTGGYGQPGAPTVEIEGLKPIELAETSLKP